jgi:hypothetical protein
MKLITILYHNKLIHLRKIKIKISRKLLRKIMIKINQIKPVKFRNKLYNIIKIHKYKMSNKKYKQFKINKRRK